MTEKEIFKMQNWYPKLSANSFPALFVPINEEELRLITQGIGKDPGLERLTERLHNAMRRFPGPKFISADALAPTDTERFRKKRGAVSSAESALMIFAESEKIRTAAAAGEVSCICVRPFRRMSPAREFRLFVKGGHLAGMSQYWLIRHFRRLQGIRKTLWEKAFRFMEENAKFVEVPDFVMDVYLTSSGKFLILDLNHFGEPTDPLMLRNWERDWSVPSGCEIVPPPQKVTGDVNVSF